MAKTRRFHGWQSFNGMYPRYQPTKYVRHLTLQDIRDDDGDDDDEGTNERIPQPARRQMPGEQLEQWIPRPHYSNGNPLRPTG